MLANVAFWIFVALDAAAIGLVFVLGLAAAGPSRTQPAAVTLLLLVAPGMLLAAAIWLHQRAASPWLRLLAFLLVSAPTALLAVEGIRTAFRVATKPGGIYGETELTRALRELATEPQRLAAVRALLADGADPNEAGEQMPLVLAVYAARHVGEEPVRLLLDRGADPNRRDEFGEPCWFAATGGSVDVAVLRLLLDRGADPKLLGRDGRGGIWDAINYRNWQAALLLLQRGCDLSGRSPMGLTLVDALEQHERDGLGDVAELLAAVRARK